MTCNGDGDFHNSMQAINSNDLSVALVSCHLSGILLDVNLAPSRSNSLAKRRSDKASTASHCVKNTIGKQQSFGRSQIGPLNLAALLRGICAYLRGSRSLSQDSAGAQA